MPASGFYFSKIQLPLLCYMLFSSSLFFSSCLNMGFDRLLDLLIWFQLFIVYVKKVKEQLSSKTLLII